MLLVQLTVLLRRHADKPAEGVIKAAAGSKSNGQHNVENSFTDIAKQCTDVIDPHCRDVLLQDELHYTLEDPHRVVGVKLHVFRDVVNDEHLIAVVGNKTQRLTDAKLDAP